MMLIFLLLFVIGVIIVLATTTVAYIGSRIIMPVVSNDPHHVTYRSTVKSTPSTETEYSLCIYFPGNSENVTEDQPHIKEMLKHFDRVKVVYYCRDPQQYNKLLQRVALESTLIYNTIHVVGRSLGTCVVPRMLLLLQNTTNACLAATYITPIWRLDDTIRHHVGLLPKAWCKTITQKIWGTRNVGLAIHPRTVPATLLVAQDDAITPFPQDFSSDKNQTVHYIPNATHNDILTNNDAWQFFTESLTNGKQHRRNSKASQ